MAYTIRPPVSSQSVRGPKTVRLSCCCRAFSARNAAEIQIPPINPKDPFLSKFASVAASSPETILNRAVNPNTPPYLDYLVPAVPDLVVAELMYLQWMDPQTTDVYTVAVGAAIGQACPAGTKGHRFMMPHAKAMIQQHCAPSSGLMSASDVLIRNNKQGHTGNSAETVANVMKRPFYMDANRAKEFGVIDEKLPLLKSGTRMLASKSWMDFSLFPESCSPTHLPDQGIDL
ncbi:T-box protein 41 [Hibiscus syriacus]|uniref:T-box protein 41 n=1 Tax=Hibiscus syriacus TaxID=106335 RepID=A0A6A2YXC5_HIBSY|nr:T-box protein 41 [Hibiscus syriacus]